jgi:lipid II:glycine glycyltransferase (peptidoglycan interpeptide bridge formation enzyme)
MGCYPLFSCQNWSQLRPDLAEIEAELITLALVTDPFGDYDRAYLQQCFQIVKPFKQHYIIDLAYPLDSYISQHHRRYAKAANRQLTVEICDNPANLLDEWLILYEALVQKHNLKGIVVFSAASFAQQLQVPGIVAIRASYEQTTVAMLLWYVDGEVGYYHLGASSPQGYSLRASYALFGAAIEYFQAQGLRWLNLGAGAGLKNNDNDGLSNFKRGWSTGTRTAYFCGRIFDSRKYAEILQARDISTSDYFPAYRQGEFG